MVAPHLEFEDPDAGFSLIRKAKQSPFLMAGMLGFTTICGVGIYKWRTKTIPTALFLVQLRVAAQGTAIGFLTLGMVYHMCNDYLTKGKDKN